MAISLEEVKKLKEQTGVGLTDAKRALEEAGGDFEKALAAMRKKGFDKAEKRGEREASQGLVEAYVHGGRIGAMVELNCETDLLRPQCISLNPRRDPLCNVTTQIRSTYISKMSQPKSATLKALSLPKKPKKKASQKTSCQKLWKVCLKNTWPTFV